MFAIAGARQPIVAPTPTNKLLPFEKTLLDACTAALAPEDARRLAQQVACINHIKRTSDWRTIELHSKRLLWNHWPAASLFVRRDPFRLATVACQFGHQPAQVEIWAGGGHVASLASTVGLSGLSIAGPLSILAMRTAD